jgi:hypothetical protein
MLNTATFYGEPAQMCDAELSKIKDLSRLIELKTFPVLFDQCFLGSRRARKIFPAQR